MWRCLTSPYFIKDQEISDRPWEEVGQHLRFNNRTEALVDDILDVLLGPVHTTTGTSLGGRVEKGSNDSLSTPFRPHPEFIAIHLRRGDIVSKCPAGVTEENCVVQIEAIANKVDEIEKRRMREALETYKKHNANVKDFEHKRLPVLVATNEKRTGELLKLERLGWILLDHGDEVKGEGNVQASKTIKLGTESRYGPWYPPVLDAVLLTRAKYMIGMRSSVMSRFATHRGAAWHGHWTTLM